MNKKNQKLGVLAIVTMVPMLSMISPINQVPINTILLAKHSEDKVKLATNENLLYDQKISISNVWNYEVVNIEFNKNNTFKISEGGGSLNPYYTKNNALTINLTEANGKILYNKSFAGGTYPSSEISNELNNKSFAMGDIITIISRSNAQLRVNGVRTAERISYLITKDGLEKLSASNIKNLTALYTGKDTIVTGITTPNKLVTLWIEDKSYTAISGYSGQFRVVLPKDVIPGTIIKVSPYDQTSQNVKVTCDPNSYKIMSSNVQLYGNWGGVYKFVKLGFNPYTMKLYAISLSNPYMCGAGSSWAYSINLYNNNGSLITKKTFLGATDAKQFEKWINSVSFKYGDYLSIKSNGLEMSVNGAVKSDNTVFGEITNKGFIVSTQPQVNVIANDLVIKSFPNATVNIEIGGRKYTSETDSSGNCTFEIPSGVSVGTPIISYIQNAHIRTMPTIVYTLYTNKSMPFSYNVFRYASISPSSALGVKGDDMTLTSLEPIPLQFSGKGKVLLDVKGDINGEAAVYVNTGAGQQYIQNIKANTPTIVDIPVSGTLILDTSNINYNGNKLSKFDFKVDATVQSGYYKQIPVFDNRGFVKIDANATSNPATFDKEISNITNRNGGAIIIGDHVRMYVANAQESLPSNLNATKTVNWYNEAFISDNELNGLSENATNELDKFHTNFFYVTSYTTDNPDGWWTGSGGTSAIPGMFKIGLTTPGWVMFHEIGHIFDPNWADSYMGCEVYSNMYTQETQLKIQGKTSWLYNGLNPKDVDKNILPIFEGYAKGLAAKNYLQDFGQGLYYFTLLKQSYPDYMAKVDDLYRQEQYNKKLPYTGIEFFPYAMAKLYHVNIIPSLEMWGCNINDQSLIQYVMKNSNKTINLVPKEKAFNVYRNMTVPVTHLNPKEINGEYVIQGIVNPNAKVVVEYSGKNYTVTCNSTGNFTINFPKGESTVAKIYGETPGKTKGYVSTISLSKAFIENNKYFNITSTNGAGGVLATVSLQATGELNFISTGGNPNWEATTNPYFMTMEVTNPSGKVTFTEKLYMHSNFNMAKNFLAAKKLPIGTIISVIAPVSNKEAQVSYDSMNTPQKNLNPIVKGSKNIWSIVVTKDGLEYIQKPNVYINKSMKYFKTNSIAGSEFNLTIGNKTYSELVPNSGNVNIALPDNMNGGEKISYKIKLGNATLVSGNSVVKGVNSTLTINDIWSQFMGSLTFDYTDNKIEVAEGGAMLNPYLTGEAFKLSLEDSNGKVIKTMTAMGHSWIEAELYNAFNNVNFKVGDKFVVQYDTSSLLSVDKVITDKGIAPYKINKNTTLYITDNGLSLIKPKNLINMNSLEKAITAGTDVSKTEYTPATMKTLENEIVAGKAILRNANATQTEVNNAANAITNAIANLKKIVLVNENELKSNIKIGQADVNSGKYTPNSMTDLKTALENANNVIANKNATQNEVDSANQKLTNAIKDLQLKANKSSLEQAIESANKFINSNDYTNSSISNLQNAINGAKADLNNPNLTNSQIKNDIKNINSAIAALQANETGLKGAIAKANAVVGSGNYTPNSLAPVKKAIADANNVLENKNATPQEVQNAEKEIATALNGTVKKANQSKLESAIKTAKKDIESGAYTNTSATDVSKEVMSGELVLKNLNATQAEVNNSVNAITNAIANLKKVVVVNKQELKNNIKTGQADINSSKYTPNSMTNLKTALENANSIVASKNATQNEVNSANQKLTNAIKDLQLKANKSSLEQVIKSASKFVNSNDYTNSSVKNLQNAINGAKANLNKPNLTNSQIKNDIKNINSAIAALQANETGLKGAIAKANSVIGSGNYAPNSITPVKKAIADANNVLENKKATPQDVQNAEKEINNALQGLVNSANTSKLKSIIATAQNDMNSGNYTKASVDNLMQEVNNGELVLKNSNATQVDINNAANLIANAIADLKKEAPKKPTNNNGNNPKPKNVVNELNLKDNIKLGQRDINSGNYTQSSVANLETALDNANNVIASKNVTQKEVDSANQKLINALDGLEVKGNKDSLKQAIKDATKYINANAYIKNSVNNLQDVINDAKADLSDSNLTETEVKNDIKNINNAIAALQTNETGLKGEIARVKAIVGSNEYTPDSIAPVKKALADANNVLENKNATPQDVKNAEKEMNNSLQDLINRANLSRLETAIKTAQKDINSGLYTKTSMDNLLKQMNAGEHILKNLNITQSEVDTQAANIQNSIDQLVKKQESNNTGNGNDTGNGTKTKTPSKNPVISVNTSGLTKAIENAEAHLNTNDYTADSMKPLENEIASAEGLLANKNITQKEVNEKINAIDNSIKELKLKPTNTPTSNKGDNTANNQKPAQGKTGDQTNNQKPAQANTGNTANNQDPAQGNTGKQTKNQKPAQSNTGKQTNNQKPASNKSTTNTIQGTNVTKTEKQNLENEINKAKNDLKEYKYDNKVIENVNNVINNSEKTLNDPSSSSTDIHTAQANVQKAINELPDTGIQQGMNNVQEDGLGLLAGLMAALGALFIFRRKK